MAKFMHCAKCGKKDFLIYVTGCPDCGDDRVEKAKELGIAPSKLEPNRDFVPNRLCRRCCPTGHCSY